MAGDTQVQKRTETIYRAPRTFAWGAFAALVVLAGIVGTIAIGRFAESRARENLIARASSIAAGINKADLDGLSGTEKDLTEGDYIALKEKMLRIRAANPDARFVYLVGYRDASLVILVDSEPTESDDYSPPGDVYAEASDLKMSNYLKGVAFSEGPYVDRWGNWVSGYAPILDPVSGQVLASAGIDIEAKAWTQELWFVRAMPIGAILFTLAIMWLLYLHRKEESRYIGEVLQNEEKLQVSEQRSRSFLEQAPSEVAIYAADGSQVFANRAWQELHSGGKPLNGAYNIKRDLQLAKAGLSPLIEKAFAGETVHIPAFRYGPSDPGNAHAARWVEAVLYPIKGADGTFRELVTIFSDMTELKEAQERALNIEERTREEFVSMASHQLRTPLTAIQGYTDMLVMGDAGKLNEKQRDFVQEIHTANWRMLDIVDTLLNASRIDLGLFAIEPEPVNLAEIVDDRLGALAYDIRERGLTVRKEFDEGLRTMQLDPKLTGIIVQNLLTNAVKYSRRGGTIGITAKIAAPNFYLAVSDDGIGIPLLQQNKIFFKLFRADNAAVIDHEGTGLGLYIVKAIVEAAGGAIRFDSKEGHGTTFYVTLPLEGMKRRESTKGLT